MKNRRTLLALGLALGLGCDKAPNPVAPSGTVLSITASPSKIGLSNQPSLITVTGLLPDGNVIRPGTQISLSTSLGALRPDGGSCSSTQTVSLAEANSGGQARALLCGDGRQGDAEIRAALLGTSGTTTTTGTGTATSSTAAAVTIKVQIGESATSKPTLVLNANPSTVPVGGTSQISLIGRNVDGTPVSAGQRIRLTADFGALICPASRCPGERPDPCNAACTNSRGEAEATYTAGARAGAGKVNAILGTGDSVSVAVTIRDAPASFTFTASPTIVPVTSPASILLTATVLNALGDRVAGASVTFSADSNIGGQFTSGSGVRTTNSSGEATDTFTVPVSELEEETDNRFQVTATVRGEGTALPPSSKEITIQR